MNRIFFSVLILFFVFMVHTGFVLAETPGHSRLLQLKGEIMEVEELKEPLGSAIYTIKDISSGATVKLLADRYRSLVKIGGEIKSAGDVLGGSRVTVIYQISADQKMPEIVFAKVTTSYA